MNSESKKQKAYRLFELTYTPSSDFPPVNPDASDAMKKSQEDAASKIRELRVNLIEKHYTEDQLDALIQFNESEMGKSIRDVRVAIQNDFKTEVPKLLNQLNSDNSGNLGAIVRVEEPKDDDT
ncbi:MAG: hypothetical protein RL839_04785 [Gammaproteobacteria bacterium]